jgi:hypothetical protein
MEEPRLLSTSSEDVDDIYQAKLEYHWWLDEQEVRYIYLNKQLGYHNRRLFPKRLRRQS